MKSLVKATPEPTAPHQPAPAYATGPTGRLFIPDQCDVQLGGRRELFGPPDHRRVGGGELVTLLGRWQDARWVLAQEIPKALGPHRVG